MERDYRALELDKILDRLAAETCCADAADLARSLCPATELTLVQRLVDETDDACRLMAGFGSPSFGRLTNVTNALRRAEAGASLSLGEFLRIAEVLRVIRSLADWRAHCAGVSTCLDDRFSVLVPNKYLEQKISSVVVNEEEVADTASPTLADIRRKMRAASARVREQLDKLVRSPAYAKALQEPIVTIRGGLRVWYTILLRRARRCLLSRWASWRRTTTSKFCVRRKKRRLSVFYASYLLRWGALLLPLSRIMRFCWNLT